YPSLRRLRAPRRLPHPTQHCPLRDVEAEHPKLAMNPGRSPGPVLRYNAEDELAHFFADVLPAGSGFAPRNPRPIELVPGAMPANDRLGLHENQHLLPSRPEPTEQNPEELV